jgi:hypothetical protein
MFGLNIKPSTFAIYLLVFVNSVLIISSAHKLFQKTVDASIEVEEIQPIKIEVLNGCGVNGIATKFYNNLTYQNYQVIGKGNADHWNYEYTALINLRPGKNDKAIEKLRKDIGLKAEDVVPLEDAQADADVQLIIGKDYQSLKIFNVLPGN